MREQEAWDLIKNCDRDLVKQAFELRKSQLRDQEFLHARENETKNTLEVELLIVKDKRDALA